MAITAYLVGLTSFSSPVDRYLRGENVLLTAEVKKGFNLFMGKANCGTCHFAPNFSGLVPPLFDESESEVLGVRINADSLILDDDLGRYASGIPSYEAEFYKHSFKTLSVRNVKFSAPYFHNGGFTSLREVMDFYNNGGGAGRGLDVPYQTLSADSLNLNEDEINAIISFMEALSDTSNTQRKPVSLPEWEQEGLETRVLGGLY